MPCAKRDHGKHRQNGVAAHEPIERAPKVVAVFRRADDTMCHTRCGRPLAFHGVRGLLEADFYCYACLTHVTIPLPVLDTVPVESPTGNVLVTSAS
jgi:hypothetical protein